MLGFFCHLLGYIFNRTFTDIPLAGVRYFGVVWTQTFGTFSHPLNIAWLSLTCKDSEQRALAMAGYDLPSSLLFYNLIVSCDSPANLIH